MKYVNEQAKGYKVKIRKKINNSKIASSGFVLYFYSKSNPLGILYHLKVKFNNKVY